jgi:hypothetical protein
MQLDNAVKGQYTLKLGALLKSSWRAVSGFKKAFWGGLFIQALVSLALLVAFGVLTSIIFKTIPVAGHWANWILQLIMSIVGFLLAIGLLMMSVKKLAGESVKARMVLAYFNWQSVKKIWSLALFHWISNLLLVYLLVAFSVIVRVFMYRQLGLGAEVGFIIFAAVLLLMLASLFLVWAACINAVLLVLNMNLNAYTALAIAVRSLWKRCFKIMGIYILAMLLCFLSMAPLLIGLHLFIHYQHGMLVANSLNVTRVILIALALLALVVVWVLPWVANLSAMVYRVLFTDSGSQAEG